MIFILSKLKKVFKKNKKKNENNNESINTQDLIPNHEEVDYNLRIKEKDENSYENIFNLIDNFMKEDETPLFTNIEIELMNRCNGACSFCPVSKDNDKREFKRMSNELFYKIISELKEIDYKGAIALHSNNEPLLDKRIYKFAEITRNKLPDAYIYLFTNGTLLDLDKFLNLMDNLDTLIIDNYADDFKVIPSVKPIYDYCLEHPELKKRVLIDLRLQNQILTSRGGSADNRNDILKLKSSCLLPFSKIIVTPSGEVSLCCSDVYKQVVLGDVSKESIVDIWKGSKFNKVRENLYKKCHARENQKLCDNCDAIVENMAYIPYDEELIMSYWNLDHYI